MNPDYTDEIAQIRQDLKGLAESIDALKESFGKLEQNLIGKFDPFFKE